jgi:lipase chaperone LimK
LAVNGFRQSEIVQILQLNKSTICKDISFLREQAKKTIKNHISDKLPFEFIKTIQGFEEILKECWITATKADKEGDTKIKLQALSLISETYTRKMDLLTMQDYCRIL